ncbi:MAG: 2,3-bisphosphoglycerate-independent phosphoglycerate mutase [Vampirovibrio sp.]|nr:2,3-bisphosphoglycerate-independent phosphoglycerate mutase [Vampirovibrio sp.]
MNAVENTPLLLLILDGWGLREDGEGNAIAEAPAAFYESLMAKCPWIPIDASGLRVGLPDGQIGNSEVGHMTMGAGRILYQELTRIDHEIEVGEFFKNAELLKAMAHVKSTGGALNLMGLVSDGGVHSSVDHLLALIDLAHQQGISNVRVHAFLDGRDVPPRSAEASLRKVEEKLDDLEMPQISTVNGRYYAMDRDTRWERTQLAYDNIVSGTGKRHPLSLDALEWAYRNDTNDEFVLPVVTDLEYEGMQDGDAVIFFNFRPDRARQITRALTNVSFNGFERTKVLNNLHYVCMTPYDSSFDLPVAYTKDALVNTLPQILSEKGIKQFRTAETEKYAHVTYFFNGGKEEPYTGEERKLIPSPKIATYDLQPEMSLAGVTEALVTAIQSKEFGVIVANFANPDMVGHTGKLPAAKDAVKAVDEAVKQVVEAIESVSGVMLLTADHGNIETMIAEDGGEHTAHTTNLVPLALIGAQEGVSLKANPEASLANIAPTMLDLLGIEVPPEMTSASLLVRQAVEV